MTGSGIVADHICTEGQIDGIPGPAGVVVSPDIDVRHCLHSNHVAADPEPEKGKKNYSYNPVLVPASLLKLRTTSESIRE